MSIFDKIWNWKLGAKDFRNILTQDNAFANDEWNLECVTALANIDMITLYGFLIGVLDGANTSMNLNLD